MWQDPTQEHLNSLNPALRDSAFWLVYFARSVGIPLWISSSVRTPTEQAALVKAGRSLTMNSKHLTGQAFDVDVLGHSRSSVPRYVWDWLGDLAEYLGMGWGGRFAGFWDPGHFESRTLN